MIDPAVITAEYNPRWPRMFEDEKRRLAVALGEVAVGIEHIGSTSVPGMAAKPIIDIDIFVRSIEPMAPYREPLERLGYIFVFDPESPTLHFFPYPSQRPRTFHVHVAETGSWYEIQDIAVREFLRADARARAEYVAVKRSLTSAHPGDINAYVAGKAPFMRKLVMRAVRWSRRRAMRTTRA